MPATDAQLRELNHNISADAFAQIVAQVDTQTWNRWLEHRDEYYRQCKKHISHAVAHYASATPMASKDIESAANLFFCVACLRWDPNGKASLPTYVASQLGLISGYVVGREARHKDCITTVEVDGKRESILDTLGSVDPDNTLLEYIKKAGPDVLKLYQAINDGYYERKTKSGESRPISAVGLYRAKVLGWDSLPRYQNALKGLQQALSAWQVGKEYVGRATLSA